MAPKIDRKNLQKRKIKVGEVLKFEADVKGEPEPAITWTLNGSALKPEERLKIENKDYHTSFALQKVTRADSGKYVVTAKNDSGTDSVEIEVAVVSKPAKPKGPLKVSHHHHHKHHLSLFTTYCYAQDSRRVLIRNFNVLFLYNCTTPQFLFISQND